MITNLSARFASFIVADKYPEEKVCQDWYPRYGFIFNGDKLDDEFIYTSTGKKFPLADVTFIRWKEGVLYKTSQSGWPLALGTKSFEEAKENPIYFKFYQ